MAKDFAEQLDAAMTRRGISGNALATLSGVSQPTISKILNRTRNASREMILKIAPPLNWDLSDALIAGGFMPIKNDDEGELERVPDEDTQILIDAYNGASPQNKELLRTMAEKIREMDSDHSIGGRNRRDD